MASAMDLGEEKGGDENENKSEAKFAKAKSCKGCLYYSSSLKSNSRNPRCFGIPRTLHQVPGNVIGQSEIEATKEGRSLTDFRYTCVGYSVYLDGKSPSAHQQGANTELPLCVGLELLVERRASATDPAAASAPAPAPVHVRNREDGREFPQPQTHKPAHSVGDDFLSRFTRNANLVASGVARNMRRVGNYVKENVDDILYPYRRRPK